MRFAAFSSRLEWMVTMAQPQPTLDKIELLEEYAAGRSVLDLGCLDHNVTGSDRWLHGRLARVASDLVGVDLLAPKIRGYKIVTADIEGFDLGRRFEVVIAGDLIEHLRSPLELFVTAARHMDPTSLFVVTTPNPFSAEQAARAWCGERVAVNPQHTCWIDPETLWELAGRSPLRLCDGFWVETGYHAPPAFPSGWPTSTGNGDLEELIEQVMEERPLARRDYAAVLRLA